MMNLGKTIFASSKAAQNGMYFENYTTVMGGFEVYFMGVRLYSKKQAKIWPNL